MQQRIKCRNAPVITKDRKKYLKKKVTQDALLWPSNQTETKKDHHKAHFWQHSTQRDS